MMTHDLDPIRIHPDRTEPDAIAVLEGIRADTIKIGKLLSDLCGTAAAYPLILHTAAAMASQALAIMQITETMIALLRERTEAGR